MDAEHRIYNVGISRTPHARLLKRLLIVKNYIEFVGAFELGEDPRPHQPTATFTWFQISETVPATSLETMHVFVRLEQVRFKSWRHADE